MAFADSRVEPENDTIAKSRMTDGFDTGPSTKFRDRMWDGMTGFFFHFLDDRYRATEGDLATRRFPKGISDPWKNPWRDFSRAMRGRHWRGGRKPVPAGVRSATRGMEPGGGTPQAPHTGHKAFFWDAYVLQTKAPQEKKRIQPLNRELVHLASDVAYGFFYDLGDGREGAAGLADF